MIQFLEITGVLVVTVPITVYFAVKFGRFGWLRATEIFNQREGVSQDGNDERKAGEEEV